MSRNCSQSKYIWGFMYINIYLYQLVRGKKTNGR